MTPTFTDQVEQEAKKEITIMCCPMCKGKGEVNYKNNLSSKQNEMRLKSIAAKRLQEKGYSIRQIMRALNYNSSQGVVDLLKKEYD